MAGNAVDLRCEALTKAGQFFDDMDGAIKDIRFIMTNYDGKADIPVPVCQVILDVNGEESKQYYSCGGEGDFVANETGMGINYLKARLAPTDQTNYGRFMLSIIEAGFPENKQDSGDISYLVGLDAHWLLHTLPNTGYGKKKGKDGKDKPQTVLLCMKINQLPWEAAKGKGKAKGKAAGKAKSEPVDDKLAETVAGIILGVLIEKDDPIPRNTLVSILFKNGAIAATGDKKGALQLATSDTFLKGRSEWTYEDGMLTMATE